MRCPTRDSGLCASLTWVAPTLLPLPRSNLETKPTLRLPDPGRRADLEAPDGDEDSRCGRLGGDRLVAQIQRSAPQEWVTAADVTGRTLTHAVTAAGTRAMAATARVALGARVPMERTLVVATSRSCAGVTRCRLETLRLDRSDLTELRRLRVRLRGRQLVLVVPAKILISPTPTQS